MSDLLFGRYEVLAQLSKRGQVATLKCRETGGDLVVLKVFEAAGENDRARIRDRAAAISSLDHDGLARARGVVEGADGLALVYDWVEGQTIASLIKRGVRFTDAQLFECMQQVLEALEHAHTRDPPVIHRDLKPQNIVWTGERFVLIDFDSAREVFADSGTASVVGTTGYAGPEQFVGDSEPRSDQYGLAATVLHMATHRHPTGFPLAGLRIDLTKTTLSVPLRRVLDRMLEPNVARRFPSAEVAREAVATQEGLEAWQIALEPLNDIRSSVTATREEGLLKIAIASRTTPTAWIKHAIGFGLIPPLYLLLSIVPQMFNDPGFSIVSLPMQMFLFIFLIYFGSRARQEFRSRVAATVKVTEYTWTLERVGSPPLHGGGLMELRRAGHSAAASTGGVTPISIRDSLALRSDGKELRFGHGLLPIEAGAVVEAVRVFQSPQPPSGVTFGEVASDAVEVEVVEAVASAQVAASE